MTTIKIKGMSCGHCVNSVQTALEAIDGTSDVQVDLKKAEASYNGDVDISVVKEAVTSIGFEVI